MNDDISKRVEEFIARSQQPVDEPVLPGTVRGMERLARIVEQQDDQPYDVELRYSGQEARPLFTVHEMVCGGSAAFGIRHDESGCWYPHRVATRELAETVRDSLTLVWCEGHEEILVENFQSLTDEDQP